MMKYLILPVFLMLGACVSKQKVTFPEPAQQAPAEPVSRPQIPEGPTSLNIDYDGLQTHLGFYKPIEKLGYSEKAFSTCEVGYGYPSNRNCRRDQFVLIHFQLLCRDSNEDSYTEALKAADMTPLRGRLVNWSLTKQSSGNITLDSNGYGQIKTTSRNSLRGQRLKINIDNENLYMKAGEINKIVTPANWCN